MTWRRPSLISVTLIAVLLVAPACGVRSHTVKGRTGTLTVTPSTGSPGTSFTLTAGGFLPGEAMTFEIEQPNKTHFEGPSHIASPQGTVSSTYDPQTGDAPGVYTVLAVGNEGTKAQGTLTVTG